MDKLDIGILLEKLIKELIESNDPQCKRLGELGKQAYINQKRLEKSLDKLQGKLDDLLVCIKYNLLDLEATRRENEQLQEYIRELNENI